MRAVVLAAGEGKRMRPLTANRPKVLLPVAGETLLGRILRQLARAGVTHADVVVSTGEDLVRAAVGDGSAFGLAAKCHRQSSPRGSGHAALAASPPEDEPYLIVNGDVYLDDDALPAVVAAGPGALAAHPVKDGRPYGVFRTDGEGRAFEVVEKSDDPPTNLVNAGVYHVPAGFTRHLHAIQPSPRGELELTDALNASFAADGPFKVVTLAQWLDVGRPWHLLDAAELALKALTPRVVGKVEPNVHLHGVVHVGEGTVLKSGTYIEGPVYIGKNCVIGPNAYLRPNTVLEDGVKVGNACEIKGSILMERTHVGHLTYVGDSVIGQRVNLGAGTLVANLRHDDRNVRVRWLGELHDTGRRKFGVVIGDNVHTGINTALNVGVVLPAGAATKPGEAVQRSPS